jgi:hypothetical protein
MPPRQFQPCIPTRAGKVPAGPDWIHEAPLRRRLRMSWNGCVARLQRSADKAALHRHAGVNAGHRNQTYRLIVQKEQKRVRKLPLAMRKTNLTRILTRRPQGIFISEFEAGEIGPDLFRKACEFGLEGLVSKHRDRPLSRRYIAQLDKGEEPEASGHGAGQRGV